MYQGGYPSYICLPPCPVGVYPAVHAPPAQCVHLRTALLQGQRTVINVSSTGIGENAGFLLPFTLRINLLPARNRAIMTNKPATESTSVQGRGECSKVSKPALKPPLRLQPALSHRRGPPSHPGSHKGFWLKAVRKVLTRVGNPAENASLPKTRDYQN